AVGIQGFVVAALLIARQGGPSLAFDTISPSAISPGAVLAATAGAALFAGLYPFVPWRYQPAQALAAAEREPLRGLLAMPAGVAASVVLLRVLGVTSIDLSNLGLPLVALGPRLALLALVLVAFAFRARARGRPSRRAIVTTIVAAAVLAGWDELHWSYVVLAAAGLTVLYAAAVSLALPEQWEVARHDVTLAHAGRRLAQGEAPPDLDMAAAVAALFSTALVASLLSLPIPDALAVLGRPLEPIDPVVAIGTVVAATILVIAARMLRPLLP